MLKRCFLIDVAALADKNKFLETFEKLSKCKDLEREISRMWYLKTTILLVGALRMISKGKNKYVDQIRGSLKI